jgi:putative flippase GtrA
VLITLAHSPIFGFRGLKSKLAVRTPPRAAQVVFDARCSMSVMSAVMDRAERLGVPIPKGLPKFLAVGVVGLVVDLGLFSLLERFGVSFLVARAISLPVATLATWLLNRRVTFAATGRKAHEEAIRYVIVTAVAQSVNYLVMLAAASYAHALPHVVAAFFGSVVATLFSYTGQRFFTFAPHPERMDPAQK